MGSSCYGYARQPHLPEGREPFTKKAEDEALFPPRLVIPDDHSPASAPPPFRLILYETKLRFDNPASPPVSW